MAISRLLSNQIGAWLQTGALGTTTNYANAFKVTQSCWLREISWYRQSVGGSRSPTSLVVWRASDQVVMFDTFSIPDNGAVGWQSYAVPYAVPLEVNVEYRVGACYPNGSLVAYKQEAREAPPSPFTWQSPPRRYNTGSCAYPATDGGTTYIESAEVGIDVDNPPPSGGGGGGQGEPLGPWFDTEPGAANLPLDNPGVYPRVAEMLDTGWAPLNTQMATVATSVGASVGANVATILGRVPQLVAAAADLLALKTFIESWFTGSAPSDWDTTVYNGVVSAQNYLAQEAINWNAIRFGLSEFPAGWSSPANIDFDTDLLWDVNADLYVLTLTSVPSTTGHGVVQGIHWYPRLGWWSPCNIDQAGPRGFVEFGPQQLYLPSLARMPGLLLKLKAGTLGNVQSWLRP